MSEMLPLQERNNCIWNGNSYAALNPRPALWLDRANTSPPSESVPTTCSYGLIFSKIADMPDAKIYRHNNILLQTSPIATVSSGHLIEPEMAAGLTGRMRFFVTFGAAKLPLKRPV